MKKTVLFLLLSLVLVLSACSNGSNNNDSDSKNKNSDSKETVTIKNNFEASGKERDGSDAKKYLILSKFQRIQKCRSIRLWCT